jgi:hypothetical protein
MYIWGFIVYNGGKTVLFTTRPLVTKFTAWWPRPLPALPTPRPTVLGRILRRRPVVTPIKKWTPISFWKWSWPLWPFGSRVGPFSGSRHNGLRYTELSLIRDILRQQLKKTYERKRAKRKKKIKKPFVWIVGPGGIRSRISFWKRCTPCYSLVGCVLSSDSEATNNYWRISIQLRMRFCSVLEFISQYSLPESYFVSLCFPHFGQVSCIQHLPLLTSGARTVANHPTACQEPAVPIGSYWNLSDLIGTQKRCDP